MLDYLHKKSGKFSAFFMYQCLLERSRKLIAVLGFKMNIKNRISHAVSISLALNDYYPLANLVAMERIPLKRYY